MGSSRTTHLESELRNCLDELTNCKSDIKLLKMFIQKQFGSVYDTFCKESQMDRSKTNSTPSKNKSPGKLNGKCYVSVEKLSNRIATPSTSQNSPVNKRNSKTTPSTSKKSPSNKRRRSDSSDSNRSTQSTSSNGSDNTLLRTPRNPPHNSNANLTPSTSRTRNQNDLMAVFKSWHGTQSAARKKINFTPNKEKRNENEKRTEKPAEAELSSEDDDDDEEDPSYKVRNSPKKANKTNNEEILGYKKYYTTLQNGNIRCRLCKRDFEPGWNYYCQHYRTHTKPFVCNNCGKRFSTSHAKESHVNSIHNSVSVVLRLKGISPQELLN